MTTQSNLTSLTMIYESLAVKTSTGALSANQCSKQVKNGSLHSWKKWERKQVKAKTTLQTIFSRANSAQREMHRQHFFPTGTSLRNIRRIFWI